MQASRALTTELSLERVLQKIAEVARDVLGARYAALGVINESGTGLSQFLTAGIDEATKQVVQPGTLNRNKRNDAIRVRHGALPVVWMYSVVNQNVQSSVGSTLVDE